MLKDLRVRAGLTQAELAERSGVCISQIRKIEGGTIAPENITLRTARRLAEVLGVRIEDLLEN